MTAGTRWWHWTALLLAGTIAAGCGSEGGNQTPGADGDVRLDEHRTLGAAVSAENLTVWPVYSDQVLDIGEFLTLQEAQEKRLAVIREIGGGAGQNRQQGMQNGLPQEPAPPAEANEPPAEQTEEAPAQPQREGQLLEQVIGEDVESAEVNTLVIENKGDLPILVCAGTIVQGGKQDRQIGQDFVIAAKSEVRVDAFCVEQGRWQALESGAATSASEALQFTALSSNAAFSVRSAAQYQKDQGKVWETVREVLKDAQAHEDNPSETLLEAVEKADEEMVAKRVAIEEKVRTAFAALAASGRRPVGFAYAVNGKPVTVRAFAHPRIQESQFPAFLKAMAMEAQLASEAEDKQTADAADVVALVQSLNAASEDVMETRASNRNGYRGNDLGYNARCYVQGDKSRTAWIPLTIDWTAK